MRAARPLGLSAILTEQITRRVNALLGEAFEHTAYAELQGRCISLSVEGLGFALALHFRQDGLQLIPATECEPDVSITGPPFALLAFVSSQAEEELFAGRVKIHGDPAVALRAARWFKQLQVPIAERLAPLTGDFVAHRVTQSGRRFVAEARRSGEGFARSLRDYLQEEIEILPTRYEFDVLRDTLANERERLNALQQRIAKLGVAR